MTRARKSSSVDSSIAASPTRITGRAVPPLVPTSGAVRVFVVGEAPGPRGADKSGYPFFGDAAGKHLYRVLTALGAVTLPPHATDLAWDGAVFQRAAIIPFVHGIALGNAFDRCPTDNGQKFRAPTRAELEGADNIKRLVKELAALSARGLRGVVTLGRVATRTLDAVLTFAPMPHIVRRAVPHPSAQGLLSLAPGRGKGARMSDLQEAWMAQCRAQILDAGFEL